MLNKYESVVNDVVVSSDSILANQRYILEIKNDTIAKTIRVLLPDPATVTGSSLIVVDSSQQSASAYLESSNSYKI